MMRKLIMALIVGGAAAALALQADAAPKAKVKTPGNCLTKAGQGTGGDDKSAAFQAWEAVLQAADWGSWTAWITTSQTVGVAPGYKVKGVKRKCGAGGSLGRQCTIQATLCK
ncbi:MAG: hypothetical protein F9K44_01915 [Hyphomicrobiaceae bacterium]|nr:MAG: hypothetical protein F9K44_01915 [Hyphomicrobiaceae bacterium]